MSELDSAMTADRAESKHLVATDAAAAIVRQLGRQLPSHHFRGPGATILPGGVEHATTIYFDTQDRDLYRDAVEQSVHLKLRAREYYSVHPSLTDLATDPRELVRYTPALWPLLGCALAHAAGPRSRRACERLRAPRPAAGVLRWPWSPGARATSPK